MCYRDGVPPLDLEGIQLACLSGLNGHGKSALLDAITWALWGKARVPHQEDLVHQGRETMSVELDFLAQDQKYRVSRKYSRSGSRGETLLELQVVTDGELVPITGNTTRETSSKISEILHMDYDTFVNTAFLLQGKADSFTTSTAARRKEVLAEVLDLSYYRRLEDKAREKSRALRERVNITSIEIDRKNEDLRGKSGREDRLRVVEGELKLLEPDSASLRVTSQRLTSRIESLEILSVERDTILLRLTEGDEEIAILKNQVMSAETKISVYEEALVSESDIRAKFTLLEDSTIEQRRLDDIAFKSGNLDREKAGLTRDIAVQRERLVGQISQLKALIDRDLKPSSDRLPGIENQLTQLLGQREHVDFLEDKARISTEEAQQFLVRMRHLEDSNASLKRIMEETRKKFDMLDKDDAICPLCQQPLGPEGYEILRSEYETQGHEAKVQYTEQDQDYRDVHDRYVALLADLQRLHSELDRRKQDIQSKSVSLERDKADSIKSGEEMNSTLKDMSDLERILDSKKYSDHEHTRLEQVDCELEELAYDGGRHRMIQEKVKSLDSYSEAHRKLLDAIESLPIERESLDKSREMLCRRQRRYEQDSRRKDDLAKELETLPALKSEFSSVASESELLEQKIQDLKVERQVIVEQLQRFAELKIEIQELEKFRKAHIDEMSIYDDLMRAFGRNGVQALIIETAIPQLQDDSNELLHRLTENRMSLKLQLQEGRKMKGLPSEELQVLISDEIGTRSYETFSGGETFRVNFALRIALSKLLARRSGAPLPILFIDEGFGSQDAAGQERLKEAIQSILSDFQKIIVITHVQEVKDSFPDRIEVVKTDNGSIFLPV